MLVTKTEILSYHYRILQLPIHGHVCMGLYAEAYFWN